MYSILNYIFQIVCATTNLCNILKEREISKPSNCYKCNQLQSELIKKFSAVESNDILNEVLNKCSQMPLPDSEACSNFVLSNFNDIYGAIKNGLSTNDYCKMTNLCTYEVRYSNDLELNELNIEEFSCKLCELLFQQLKDHTIANLTVSQFKSNLDKFCHKQHNFENICLNTVQQFYIPLYDFVSKLNDIKGMCHLIGACQRKADTYTQVIDSSKEIILELKLNLKCLLCKNVIHLTKSILGNRNSRVIN